MRKKNGTGGINLLGFKLYYKATVIKTVWYWHKDRNIDQWNKTESPEINPRTMDTLSLTKEARIYNGEKTISLTSGAGKTTTYKRMKLEHFLTPYTKINSKWIKDINARPETIKLVEENRSKNTLEHKSQQYPLRPISQKIGNKSKNKQVGPN